MAQKPPADPAAFDAEIKGAETAYKLSAVTAQILGRVAAHSQDSAGQLTLAVAQITDPNGGLGPIAGNLQTIAGRGDPKSPVCVTTSDNQPFQVTVDTATAQVIKNFLEIIGQCADLKGQIDKLRRDLRALELKYDIHRHSAHGPAPIPDDRITS